MRCGCSSMVWWTNLWLWHWKSMRSISIHFSYRILVEHWMTLQTTFIRFHLDWYNDGLTCNRIIQNKWANDVSISIFRSLAHVHVHVHGTYLCHISWNMSNILLSLELKCNPNGWNVRNVAIGHRFWVTLTFESSFSIHAWNRRSIFFLLHS